VVLAVALAQDEVFTWRRKREFFDPSFGGYEVFRGSAPKYAAVYIGFKDIERLKHSWYLPFREAPFVSIFRTSSLSVSGQVDPLVGRGLTKASSCLSVVGISSVTKGVTQSRGIMEKALGVQIE
jgi:hypothetical protein